jgi:hypothetical protein
MQRLTSPLRASPWRRRQSRVVDDTRLEFTAAAGWQSDEATDQMKDRKAGGQT